MQLHTPAPPLRVCPGEGSSSFYGSTIKCVKLLFQCLAINAQACWLLELLTSNTQYSIIFKYLMLGARGWTLRHASILRPCDLSQRGKFPFLWWKYILRNNHRDIVSPTETRKVNTMKTGCWSIQPRVQWETVSLTFFQWDRAGHKEDWGATQTPARTEKIPTVLRFRSTSYLVSACLRERIAKSGEQFSLMLQGPKALKEKVIQFSIWCVEPPRGAKLSSWRVFKRLHWKSYPAGARHCTQAL